MRAAPVGLERMPSAIVSAIVSIAARLMLAVLYSLALILCKVIPRGRCWAESLPGCIAVTGTFYNPGWFRAHMVPLARSGVCVIVVSDKPLQGLANVCPSCPPSWLLRLAGRSLAKLVWLMIISIRHRPALIMG